MSESGEDARSQISSVKHTARSARTEASDGLDKYNAGEEERALQKLEDRLNHTGDHEDDDEHNSSYSASEDDSDSDSDTESTIGRKKREAAIRAQEDARESKDGTLPGLALVDEQVQAMMHELSADVECLQNRGREMDEAAMGRLAHTQAAMSLQLFGMNAAAPPGTPSSASTDSSSSIAPSSSNQMVTLKRKSAGGETNTRSRCISRG
jgi:hypothetical protein